MKMTEAMIAQAEGMRESGMFYREIGAALGVSKGTVNYQLNPMTRSKQLAYASSHKEELAAHRALRKEDTAACKAAYYAVHREDILAEKKRYYSEHREKIRSDQTDYYASHRQECISRQTVYAAANREQIRAVKKEYYLAHREERRAYGEIYRSTRREEAKARTKAWGKSHPNEISVYAATRRALIAGVTIGNLAEIAEIYRKAREEPNIRCYLCGEMVPLGSRHVDHISPLSRGGEHRPSNLAVACATCNLKKNDKLPEEMGLLI